MIGKNLLRNIISPRLLLKRNHLHQSSTDKAGLPEYNPIAKVSMSDLIPVIGAVTGLFVVCYLANPVRTSYPGGRDPQKWKEGHSHN